MKEISIYKVFAENCETFNYTFYDLINNEPIPTSIKYWANNAHQGWQRLAAFLNPLTKDHVILTDRIA